MVHGWEHEKASLTLRNCHDSLPGGGILYLIENFSDLVDASLLSLNTLAMCRSYERISEQYQELLIKSGFEIEDHKKLNQLQNILVAEK